MINIMKSWSFDKFEILSLAIFGNFITARLFIFGNFITALTRSKTAIELVFQNLLIQ